MTNPYLFDALFLLIIFGTCHYGKKHGAFRVIAGLFGTAAAWIGTLILRPMALPFVVNLLNPWAVKAVTKAAEAAGSLAVMDVTMDMTSETWNAAQSLTSLGEKLTAYGFPVQMGDLAEKLNISATLQNRLHLIPQGQVRPLEVLAEAMIAKVAPLLTFFLLFFTLKLIIQIVVRILSLDWPIIRTLNHMAGGIIGLGGGLLLVLVVFFGILIYGSPEPTGITSQVLVTQSMTGSLIAGLFT